jgi:hypothetical protein
VLGEGIKMKLLSLLIIMTFNLQVFAQESVDVKKSFHNQYTFKQGDTISDVLHNLSIDPLYGNGKNVTTTLKLNRLTEEQAKQLKQGDIILLPTLQELSSTPAVVYKTINISKKYENKPLEGEFFLTYSGRNEKIDFGSAKIDGNLYNNIGIRVQSDLNRSIDIYNLELSGYFGGALERLDDPSEEDGNGGSVNVTNYYQLFGGLYIESIDIQAKPFVEWQFEQFDGFDLKNDEIIRRRNKISWIGVGLKHTFYFWEQPLVVKPSLAYTIVTSSEQAGDVEVDGLSGFKTNFEANFTLDSKWMIGAELSYYNFREFDNYNITKYMLMFGRKI